MLCSLVLRLKTGEVRQNPIIRFFKGIYVPVLKWTIAHRYLTLILAAALLAWSVADVFIIGSEFLPTIDEGNFLVRATMPASISLSRAVEISTQIERTLKSFPEVDRAQWFSAEAAKQKMLFGQGALVDELLTRIVE